MVLLEDSSAAMAEDLVNKATIIEQFLKEKSGEYLFLMIMCLGTGGVHFQRFIWDNHHRLKSYRQA